MPGRMAGRRALVTGGAGAIGLACARRLLAEGADVVLLDRNADALSAAGLGAAPVACDIRDPGAVAAAVTRAAGLLNGPADVLVNSAGVYRIAPLLDLTPDEWDDMLAVNLRGTFLAGRAMAAALIAAGRPGAIVNISSTAGLVGAARHPRERGLPRGHRHADAADDGRPRGRRRLPANRRPAGASRLRGGGGRGRRLPGVRRRLLPDRRHRPGGRWRNCDLRSSQMNQFPHVRVEGSALDRGRAYGGQARDRVQRSVAAYRDVFADWAGWDWATVRREAARYEAPI